MGRFYFSIKTSKLIRALKKLGFTIEHGSKHDLAYLKNGPKTTIPRSNTLKKGTSESICEFVVKEAGISEDKLLGLLR
ncbi:MAG: type II toxin-antitoxin system HicA family toxin [Patescibacteria group bacterium]